jgi:serine/threonine-protein kinase
MNLLKESLSARLSRHGPLPPADAARLAAQVARAMHHAHQRGILHRDLKAGNILLDEHGQPHVADFGLARRLDTETSLRSMAGPLGTPSCMAPEQARGEKGLTTAVDVYGLGAVLYQMLTGDPPFHGESLGETLNQVLTQPVAPPSAKEPGVPADLEEICLRCLRKETADRYRSAEAVAENLERFLRGEPPQDRRPGVGEQIARAVRHRVEVPSLITWAALVWVVVIVVAQHGGIFLLAWAGQPIFWAWLLMVSALGMCSVVLWRFHYRHYASLHVPEKQSLVINVGHILAILALLAATSPLSPLASTRELLPAFYPALMILAGLTAFMHGFTHWGIFFVIGIAHLPLAFVLRLVPDWAPLLYAGCSAGCLLWTARAMHHLAPKPHPREQSQ